MNRLFVLYSVLFYSLNKSSSLCKTDSVGECSCIVIPVASSIMRVLSSARCTDARLLHITNKDR